MQKVRTTKWEKKTDAELGAGGGVGDHAGAVIFAEHDEDTGTTSNHRRRALEEKPRAGAGGGDTDAVVGAVNVFVSDYYFGFGGDGLISSSARRCAGHLHR